MEKGHWNKGIRTKDGAYETIDNITKFALADDDYEVFEEWVEYSSKELAKSRIAELKHLLFKTDYVAAKIAEGVATREEYESVLSQRQRWRDEINELLPESNG